MFYSIEDALEVLMQGKMVVIVDDADRENEGDLVALAEKATPEMINFMITQAKGLVCCPISEERAQELQLPLMAADNTDPNQTAFTVSVDHVSNSTGISAPERSDTIRALVQSDTKPNDFRRPGHIFPLIAKPGGVLQRPGHTEAAVDLARLCGAYPAGIICEIIKEDGTMARVPDLLLFCKRHGLVMITIADLIHYRSVKETISRQLIKF